VLGLGVGAAAGLAAPAVARAQLPIAWRMATPWPRNMPGFWAAAERIAASITAMSGGRLAVVAHPAGELVPPGAIFDAVGGGDAELGHAAAHHWLAKNPAFQFFSGVPFGLTAQEHEGWIRFGGGQKLWERAYGPHGVLPFLAGNTGPQAGGWFSREIRGAIDFQGLKIRMTGPGAEVLRRLGAVTVDIPPSDIFPAMQSGQLDAAEWVGPWNDLAFGFHKIARFYYLPSFHEPGAALELIANAEAFASLDTGLQAVIRTAAAAASAETFADFTYHNAIAHELIATRTNAVILPLPEPVIRALGETAAVATQEAAASSQLARTIHASYRDHLAKAVAYSRAVDRVTLAQRELGLK
jgi:TRAP-type mannitol/chloroaromatic compound transport system substrate-binding protein